MVKTTNASRLLRGQFAAQLAAMSSDHVTVLRLARGDLLLLRAKESRLEGMEQQDRDRQYNTIRERT